MQPNSDKLQIPASYHIRNANLRIGASIAHTHKIYLDTRYWIYCRDAASGTHKDPRFLTIYELLLELTTTGRAVCPPSAAVLAELFKQPEHDMQMRTAAVIDSLSQSVAFQSRNVVRLLEFLYVLTQIRDTPTEGRPIHQRVWGRPAWLFGLALPGGDEESDDPKFHEARIEHFERESSATIITLVERFGTLQLNRDDLDDTPLLDRLNRHVTSYKLREADFDDLVDVQLDAIFEANQAIFAEALRFLATKDGLTPSLDDPVFAQGAKETAALLLARLLRDGTPHVLPFAYVSASVIAAAIRQGRTFKQGDWYDMQHATYAIPYCSTFLTERSLGAMLNAKPGQLASTYHCEVIADLDKAIDHLRKLTTSISRPQ